MSKDVNRFLRSATVYTILSFLPAGFGLILTPLFTNHLQSTSEFGLLTLANFFFAFFGVCIGLGFDSAYSVMYFHYNRNPHKQKALLQTILVLILGTFLVVGLVLQLIGDFLFDKFLSNSEFTYSQFGRHAFILALSNVLNAVFLAYHRNENNLQRFTLQSVCFAFVPVFIQLVCLFFISNTAQAIIQYRSIASISVVAVFVTMFFLKTSAGFDKSFLKPLFNLSVPFTLYGIIIFFFENIDRLIVERSFKDLHVLSIYGLALTFAAIAELFRASIASALSPSVFQVMADDNNPQKINGLYRLFVWAVLILICLLLVAIEPIFGLFITNKDFNESLLYIPFLFIALLPKIFYSIYQLPLSYYSKVKPLPVINLVSLLVGLGCCLVTISDLHLFSVILAVFVSRTMQSILSFFYLKANLAIYRRKEIDLQNEFIVVGVCSILILVTSLLYSKAIISFWVIGALPLAFLLLYSVKIYGRLLKQFGLASKTTFRFFK